MPVENGKIQQEDNNKVEYRKPVVCKLGHACIALRSTMSMESFKDSSALNFHIYNYLEPFR